MDTIKKILDKLLEWVMVILLAIMTILVTYQVIVRYFFNNPNAYTEVLSKYMFVWLIMFGSAYVFGLREHMNIAILREKLPAKARIIVEMIGELITVVFAAGVMVFGGFKQMSDQMVQLDSALQIPMGIIYAAVPISACFIVFYFIHIETKLFLEFKAACGKGRK